VIEDLHWKTALDQEIKPGQTAYDRAQLAARLFDERYGTDESAYLAHLQTQGQAEQFYTALRAHLYPSYSQWDRAAQHRLDAMLEQQPAG
jgi:hypothetical protein